MRREPDNAAAGTSLEATIIRRAVVRDAEAIAGLHIRSWQHTYRGMLPDRFLDGLSEGQDQRVEAARNGLANEGAEVRTWVAERADQVVGFAITGPSRDADAPPTTGEVVAIYLEPAVVGTGIGRALFEHAVADLRARGYQEATLWVLEMNSRARRFYEAAGWRPDGATKTEERPGAVFHEVRYRLALAKAEPRTANH
jgi:GNAT superfamily N-acetyltransferase